MSTQENTPLSPDEIAKLPMITHGGRIPIGTWTVNCGIIDGGKRIVSIVDVAEIFSYKGESEGTTARLASLINKLNKGDAKKFITNNSPTAITKKIPLLDPVKYRTENGTISYGIEADALADLCEAILECKDKNLLTTKAHINYADNAQRLIRAFFRVGLIALIDEATGYQKKRIEENPTALRDFLSAYISDVWAKWTKEFPEEFYREIFRLRGWMWKGMKVNRPSVVGHITNDLIYSRLAPGILDRLRELNPPDEKGSRKYKHHSRLTRDLGIRELQLHLNSVLTLARDSHDWEMLLRKMDKQFPRTGATYLLGLGIEFENYEDSLSEKRSKNAASQN
jgi:hypothetical protein